jgi:long-chain fatty acid transport protein
MIRSRATGALLALAAAFAPTLATAQDEPTPCFATDSCSASLPAIPFDILPPGARSLGIGGAFVGVADDATAAEANPAGMTILTRPEISLHGRHASYDVEFLDPNGFDGIAAGADTPNPPIGTFDDSNNSVSFASFVYPFSRFVIAGYYQNSGRIEDTSTISGFEPTFIDTYIASTYIDAEVESFGLSGAFRLNDMFSVGMSLKSTSTDVTFIQASTLSDFRDEEGNLAEAAIIDDELSLASTNRIDDDDFTWNIGLLINPNGKFSAGVVYRENGSYDAEQSLFFVDLFNCNGAPNCARPPVDLTTELDSQSASFDLPDIFSVGVAWRHSDTWLLAFQLDNVGYDDQPEPAGSSLIFGEPIATDELNDEWIWHAGVEKVFIFEKAFLGMSLLSLRGGAFSNPDHDGYDQLDTDDTSYTVGFGTVFGERFQVDAAWQFADQIDTFVMSGVYRF